MSGTSPPCPLWRCHTQFGPKNLCAKILVDVRLSNSRLKRECGIRASFIGITLRRNHLARPGRKGLFAPVPCRRSLESAVCEESREGAHLRRGANNSIPLEKPVRGQPISRHQI